MQRLAIFRSLSERARRYDRDFITNIFSGHDEQRESENRDEKRENALKLQAIKRSILFKKQYRREYFTF